jgi:hypothetical protein
MFGFVLFLRVSKIVANLFASSASRNLIGEGPGNGFLAVPIVPAYDTTRRTKLSLPCFSTPRR